MHLLKVAAFEPEGLMGEAHSKVMKEAHSLIDTIKGNVPDNHYRMVACEMIEVALHYCNNAMVAYGTGAKDNPKK
ncbi:MAG: hypothetical protein GWN00_01105 [Aliifodinibius sp.]|nr:hypothetical protein [Fodinibius sp.]NIV09929.1 hypothetical protein [Fodinibius sp.]NIY23459.1 hypothetical protein [Fodinibius sp.]